MDTKDETEGSRILLSRDEMPKRYYNILADLPWPVPPPLNPTTMEPIGPQDLAPLFPMELIKQEVSPERFIDIPEALMDAYFHFGRPSPLHRARRLEQALNTRP